MYQCARRAAICASPAKAPENTISLSLSTTLFELARWQASWQMSRSTSGCRAKNLWRRSSEVDSARRPSLSRAVHSLETREWPYSGPSKVRLKALLLRSSSAPQARIETALQDGVSTRPASPGGSTSVESFPEQVPGKPDTPSSNLLPRGEKAFSRSRPAAQARFLPYLPRRWRPKALSLKAGEGSGEAEFSSPTLDARR